MNREQDNKDSKDNNNASQFHKDDGPWTQQEVAQMIQDAYSAGYAKACEDTKQALDEAAKDAVSKALSGSDAQTKVEDAAKDAVSKALNGSDAQTKVEDAVVKALGGETVRAEMKKILQEESGESSLEALPENPKTPPNVNKQDTKPESTSMSNKIPAASAQMIQAPRSSSSSSNSQPPINGCRLCSGYIINSFAQWKHGKETGLPPMPVKWGHLKSVSLQDGTIVSLVKSKHIIAPEHRLLILGYKAHQWEKGPLLPNFKSFTDEGVLGLNKLNMVCAGGKLFLISCGHVATMNLASFGNPPSLDGMDWAVYKSMLDNTYATATAVSEDNRYLFVVGGNHRVHTRLRRVDVFDTHTLKVTNSFPTSEDEFTSAEVIGNKLFVTVMNGGLMSATIIQHNDLSPTLRADTNGEVFSAVHIYPKLSYGARMIAQVGSSLMVVSGGFSESLQSIETEQNVVYKMSVWSGLGTKRRSVLALPDGHIVVIGGKEGEQEQVNMICSLPLMKVCVSGLIDHLIWLQQECTGGDSEILAEIKRTQQALLAALLPKTFGPAILESILRMMY